MARPSSPRGPGRPSSYTDALADLICDRIAAGESLRQICADAGMPDRTTVLRWIRQREDFAARCARAWELQALGDAERQREVIEQVASGELAPDTGRVVLGGLQWLSERRAPRWLGTRRVEVAGDPTAPLHVRSVVELSDEALAAIAAGAAGGD